MEERIFAEGTTEQSAGQLLERKPHDLPRHRAWGGQPFQILVVTPPGSHLSSITRVLQNYGLSARGFSDGLRAREWLVDNKDVVVAAVIDEAIPILGGEKLASLLEEEKLGLSVALMSKNLEPELVDRFLSKRSRSLFRKPVDYGELVPWLFQNLPTYRVHAETLS